MEYRLVELTLLKKPSLLTGKTVSAPRNSAQKRPIANSLEKPLAERRKSVYTEHRTSRLWFGGKNFLRFQPKS